ncbi:hypothetical protein EHQ59_12720 [Leptospira kemamanensis]|uniref:Hint domain-containing protein n=1 Tax=Leptospira kemamanensis TaxID=2484942 RepID=A0A4R9JR89_9LEPT|nr:polymorphic toxin-type HINT domain-containing protein [Leptospira kemamanensis]TGL50810.1 hypothetical protein EHQ59_12720 [Leptospira kemamanensis]
MLSKSDETGEVSYRKVLTTFIRQTDAIYKVSFADETILETTWNHPFRVIKQDAKGETFTIENTTWVEAKDLHPGDVALGADGRELVVTDITIDEREETVYSFEVDEYHTYFVGEVGVWVHNESYSSKFHGCRYNGVCDSITVKLSHADGSKSTLEFNNTSQGNVAVYVAENGDVLSKGGDGNYYRMHKDVYGKQIVTSLNESISEEKDLYINGDKMVDGGIVKMDSKGKLQVVNLNDVKDGSTVFNNGMNANASTALEYMGILKDNIPGKQDVYLVFNRTEGIIKDTVNVGSQQSMKFSDTSREKSEETLYHLAKNGKIGTLITYSQGTLNAGRMLNRLDQEGEIDSLSKISLVSLGGGHSSLIT